jgi:hypothetical protein
MKELLLKSLFQEEFLKYRAVLGETRSAVTRGLRLGSRS